MLREAVKQPVVFFLAFFVVPNRFEIQVFQKIFVVAIVMLIAQIIAPVEADHCAKVFVQSPGADKEIVRLDREHIRLLNGKLHHSSGPV